MGTVPRCRWMANFLGNGFRNAAMTIERFRPSDFCESTVGSVRKSRLNILLTRIEIISISGLNRDLQITRFPSTRTLLWLRATSSVGDSGEEVES